MADVFARAAFAGQVLIEGNFKGEKLAAIVSLNATEFEMRIRERIREIL